MHRALLAFFLLTATALAQHDAERNAVRHIALGEPGKAEKALRKTAESYESEAAFVRMMIALERGAIDDAVAGARESLDMGLPFARLLAGPRDLLAPLYETADFKNWAAEHPDLKLLHGPMLGALTSTSASFWVRTAAPAAVRITVGDQHTAVAQTTPESDHTAVLEVTGLEPATGYAYTLEIDGQKTPTPAEAFTTFPAENAPARFKVAFGGGAGFVPKWEYMWNTIRSFEPDALFMLGDNVYIDQPEYLLCQHYCYYRRHDRPEWRRLVGGLPTYAIYDDHDFGTNDCVPGPGVESPPWKRSAWNVFRQNWVNPSYGGGETQPGCWFDTRIGDVHFIFLDGRYYRDHEGGTMLGPIQKAWLKKTLAGSNGTFVVLASPVPWTAGIKPGSRDPWDGYPAEREEIFSFIEKEKIDGVFLIAADRHRTDLRITARPAGYDLYEFESSRLTNRHVHKVVETPGLQWGYNETCSFALMSFDTTAPDPAVIFDCITIQGERAHSHTLRASQLRH